VVYILVLPLVVVLLQLRSIVRPELISYSFAVVAVMLYYRARNSMSTANMLPMVALMLVWANYHSLIFGYVIFFGYFFDVALQQIRQQAPAGRWLQWLGWGLAVVAVGFLRPGFSHPLIKLFYFSPEWKNLILEYQSAFNFRDVVEIYSLVAVALLTLVLLLWKRQFGLLVVCSVLIYFSADMVRLVAPSGIVILCIFAWVLSEFDLKSQLQRLPRAHSLAMGGAVMVLFVLSLGSSVTLARAFMEENRHSGRIFPSDVVDYMIDQGISGRIINEYETGGYLIYRLSPGSQVYIDGRTGILYPIEHYRRMLEAGRSPGILRAEIQKYDVNLAVLKNEHRTFARVRSAGMLELDYVGDSYLLFRRDNANFPVLGTLLPYPACWKAEMAAALEQEQTRAAQLMPGNSVLLPFIQFAIDFSNADDKSSFLTALEEDSQWSDPKLRFAGHQALIQNLDSIAYELFAAISYKEFSDYLGGALAKARLGEWQKAEQTLDLGTRLSWSENVSEISILHALLTLISQNYELRLFEDAYMNQLAEDIGSNVDSASSFGPNPHSFCPDT
jgi:hypothetical protein